MIIMIFKGAKSIWYFKYQIYHLQKVFGKVFKYPKISMYQCCVKYSKIDI